jgi:ABC-type Fe3+-hydroxamate transport system substrate-binding protein
MKVVDQLNRSITLKKVPERIISLVPSITETIHYLGLEDSVAGITKFCIHPISWKRSKAIVGGTKTVNIDKVKKLDPDLIIANKEENSKEDIEELAKLFPVYVSDIKSFDDFTEFTYAISKITNTEEKGNQLVTETFKVKHQIKNYFLKREKLEVAYFIWKKPYMLAGNNTYINYILEFIGLTNSAKSLNGRYPELREGEINPDYIFLSSEPYPFAEKHLKEFEKIYPKSKCFVVDGEVFSWYGPRILKLESELQRILKLNN